MTSRRDRAIGALVGLAVGDAVGTALEFEPPGSFEPITDMVGRGPFGLPVGAWTGDTSMAMCLAESILDTGDLDPADQLRRYRAIVDADIDDNSAATGSLMRLAAVPIRWHSDIAVAADRSAESSRTTHPASRHVDACRLTGAMLAALVQGVDATDVFGADFWQWGDLDPPIRAIADGSWRAEEPPEIRGTGYSVAALEAALWAVGGADDFRSAVLRAANLGDDADTAADNAAAIAGQLAGARWGVSGIPADLRDKIVRAERIAAIAGRLHDAAIGAPVEEPWPHDATVHGWWVEPGSVLAGEYPGAETADAAEAKIDLLVDHGVRTFVDLTHPVDGLVSYADHVERIGARRGLELRHRPFPIPDMGVRPHRGYDEIVDAIRAGADGGVVYVHCWGGIGRTSTVVGCLLVDAGLDADAALAEITRRRSVTRKAHRSAPQTDPQIDVIRSRAR